MKGNCVKTHDYQLSVRKQQERQGVAKGDIGGPAPSPSDKT